MTERRLNGAAGKLRKIDGALLKHPHGIGGGEVVGHGDGLLGIIRKNVDAIGLRIVAAVARDAVAQRRLPFGKLHGGGHGPVVGRECAGAAEI